MWPHLVILAMDNTKVATSTWHTIVDNSLNYQTTTIPATGGYKQIGHDGTSWLKILWNNKVHLCEATTAYCYSDGELNMKLQYQTSGWGSQDYKAGVLSISPQLFADMGLKHKMPALRWYFDPCNLLCWLRVNENLPKDSHKKKHVDIHELKLSSLPPLRFTKLHAKYFTSHSPLAQWNPTPQVHRDPWHELCNHQNHRLQTESYGDQQKKSIAQNEHSWFVAAHHSLDLLFILLKFI